MGTGREVSQRMTHLPPHALHPCQALLGSWAAGPSRTQQPQAPRWKKRPRIGTLACRRHSIGPGSQSRVICSKVGSRRRPGWPRLLGELGTWRCAEQREQGGPQGLRAQPAASASSLLCDVGQAPAPGCTSISLSADRRLGVGRPSHGRQEPPGLLAQDCSCVGASLWALLLISALEETQRWQFRAQGTEEGRAGPSHAEVSGRARIQAQTPLLAPCDPAGGSSVSLLLSVRAQSACSGRARFLADIEHCSPSAAPWWPQ